MPKATLTLDDGTVVQLESTDEGIAKILSGYNAGFTKQTGKPKRRVKGGKGTGKVGGKKTPAKTGLQPRIEELTRASFFKSPRPVPDVVAELLKKGFKHKVQPVSTALIRQVRKGNLDRQHDGKQWTYFEP